MLLIVEGPSVDTTSIDVPTRRIGCVQSRSLPDTIDRLHSGRPRSPAKTSLVSTVGAQASALRRSGHQAEKGQERSHCRVFFDITTRSTCTDKLPAIRPAHLVGRPKSCRQCSRDPGGGETGGRVPTWLRADHAALAVWVPRSTPGQPRKAHVQHTRDTETQ